MWGERNCRAIEALLKKRKSSSITPYRPFGFDTNLSISKIDNVLWYESIKTKYCIDISNCDFVPKSGVLLCEPMAALYEKDPFSSVLDIGTGPAMFLARHAAALGATTIDAVDVDENVLMFAESHQPLYEKEVINVQDSDIFSHIDNRKYDLIVSNPPQMPQFDGLHPYHDMSGENGRTAVETIIRDAHMHLTEGGRLMILLFDFLGVERRTNSISSVCVNWPKILDSS